MSTKYQPLYLKHRPQSLKQLVGQQSVVTTLRNALENDRLAHAYLFTGPRGTGKTSSARILAKSINCDKGPTVDPCLECASCQEVRDSTSTSVFEIDAASNNSVDDARTIIERAPLVAAGGRKKLYIIDECHMLTKEAFNALLKTIEEPPPNVIFILATTEEHKVPPTIVSRCQRLMFRLVNHKDLIEHLKSVAKMEDIAILDDAIELIARRSGGGLRDALGLLDQASLLARPEEPVKQSDLLVLLGALEEDVLLELSDAVIRRDGKQMIDSANKLLEAGREPGLIALELAKHFLNLTKASYVNDASIKAKDLDQFILGSDRYLSGLLEQCRQFERVELSQIVEQLDRMEGSLKRSSMPSLALEIGLLSVCHRHEVQSLKEVVSRLDDLEKRLEGDLPPQAHRPSARTEEQRPAARPAMNEPAPAQRYEEQRPAARPAMNEPAPAQRYEEQRPAARPAMNESPPPQQYEEPRPAPRASEPDRYEEPTPATRPSAEPQPEHVDEYSRPAAQAERAVDRAPQEHGEENDAGFDEPPETDDLFASARSSESEAREPAPAREENHAPARTVESSSADRGAPAEASGEGELSASALDELWSELLDAIHKRSIPAYSLVSVHAFPIRMENGTLILGVRKEFFQKSIENKTTALQQAYKDIRRDEIRILVKVFTDEAAVDRARASDESAKQLESPRANSASPARPPAQDSPRSSAREPEPAPSYAREERREPATGSHAPHSISTRESSPPPSHHAEPDRASEAPRSASGEREKPKARSMPIEESSSIKEAYDIFEGPGSRMI